MSKLKRRKVSFIAKIRNYFITGIVVLVPIGITLYLTKFFVSISSNFILSDKKLSEYPCTSKALSDTFLSGFK